MTLTGLARLLREPFAELRGKRIGLVAHPAAILPDCTHALAALRLSGLKVTTVFGPEHGWSGAAADGVRVTHAHDERAAVTVYSLYGDGHEPTAGMLAEVDALIFDMQDVGARFYTYASTLFYVLRAAGRAGLPVWVLDRPNPINGVSVEGPLVAPGHESFVGIAPIPIRHGLTLGELARFFNAHFALQTDLTVVALEQWRRAQWFDETGLPWAPRLALGADLAQRAASVDGCRLPGDVPARGHEPLGWARHGPAVRDLWRALGRWRSPDRGAERA